MPGDHLLVVPHEARPVQDCSFSSFLGPWKNWGGGAPESNQVPPNTIEFVEGRTVSLPNTVPGRQWVLNDDTCNLLCFQHCYKSFINVNLFNSVINPARQVLLLSPRGKAPCLRQPSQREVQVGFEPGKSGSIRLSHKPICVC